MTVAICGWILRGVIVGKTIESIPIDFEPERQRERHTRLLKIGATRWISADLS
jgi:hypothetical protein